MKEERKEAMLWLSTGQARRKFVTSEMQINRRSKRRRGRALGNTGLTFFSTLCRFPAGTRLLAFSESHKQHIKRRWKVKRKCWKKTQHDSIKSIGRHTWPSHIGRARVRLSTLLERFVSPDDALLRKSVPSCLQIPLSCLAFSDGRGQES